jgi:hypothetical protein
MHRDAGTTAATDPGQTTHQAHEELKTATSVGIPESTPRSEQGRRTDTFTGKIPECSTPNRQHWDLAREVTADQDQQPDTRSERSPVPKGTQGTYKTAGYHTNQTPEDDSDSNQEEDHLLRPLTSPQVTYDNATTIANRRDQIGQNFAFTRINKINTPVLPANHVKQWRAAAAEPRKTKPETKATTGSRSGHKRTILTRLNRRRSSILIQPGMRKSPMRLANKKVREEAAAAATADQAEDERAALRSAQDTESPFSASETSAAAEGQRPRSPEALAAAGQGGEEREGVTVTDLNSASEASVAAEGQRPRSPEALAAVRQGGEERGEGDRGEPDSASETPVVAEGRRPRSPETLAAVSQGGEEDRGRDRSHVPVSEFPTGTVTTQGTPASPTRHTEEEAPTRPLQTEGIKTQDRRMLITPRAISLPYTPRDVMTTRVTMALDLEEEHEPWHFSPQTPPLSPPATSEEQEAEGAELSDSDDAGASSDRKREDSRHRQDQEALRGIRRPDQQPTTNTPSTRGKQGEVTVLTSQRREGSKSTPTTPAGDKAPATPAATIRQQTTGRNTVHIPESQGKQGTLPQHWTKGPAPTGFTLVAHGKKDTKERLQDAAAAKDPKDPRSIAHRSQDHPQSKATEQQPSAAGKRKGSKKQSYRKDKQRHPDRTPLPTDQGTERRPAECTPHRQSQMAGKTTPPHEAARAGPMERATPPPQANGETQDSARVSGANQRRKSRLGPRESYMASYSKARDYSGDYSPYTETPARPAITTLQREEQIRTEQPESGRSPPTPTPTTPTTRPSWVPEQRLPPIPDTDWSTIRQPGNRAIIVRGIPSTWSEPKVLQALEIAAKQVTALEGTSRTFAKRLPRGDWVVTLRTPEEARATIEHGNRIALYRQDGKRISITIHAAGGPSRTTITDNEARRQLVCRLPFRYGKMLAGASREARDAGRPVLAAHKSLIQQWLGESADKVTGTAMGRTGAILLTFGTEAAAMEATAKGVVWKSLQLQTKGFPKRPGHDEMQPPSQRSINNTKTGTEHSTATPRAPDQYPQTTMEDSGRGSKILVRRTEETRDRDWLSQQVEEEAQRQKAPRMQGEPATPPPASTQPPTAPAPALAPLAPRHLSRLGAPMTELTANIRRSVKEAADTFDSGPITQANRDKLVYNCIQGILRAFEALVGEDEQATPTAPQSTSHNQTNGQTVRGTQLSNPPG